MKFLTISLTGFRKYLEQVFSFEPGLNVFWGANEAGKTTLHQALVTALYGLGSKSAQLLRTKDEVRNWQQQAVCKLALELELGQDRYLINRDLLNSQVVLFQHDKATDSYITKSEDAKAVAELLAERMAIPSADIFNQTISIQQNQMTNLSNLEEIGEAIEAIFTGDESVSIQNVFDNLNTFRKQLKKRGNEKFGKIDTLSMRFKEVESALASAQTSQQEHQQLEDRFNQLSALLPKKEKRLHELQDLLNKSKTKIELEKKRDDLRINYKRINEQLRTYENQQTRFQESQASFQRYSKIDEQSGGLEELILLTRDIKEIQSKIQEEQEQEQITRERMVVLVENEHIFLSPKAIWISSGLIIAGVVAAFLLTSLYFLAVSGLGVIWLALKFWRGSMFKLKEKQIKSEVIQQLESELANRQKQALHKLNLLQLDDSYLQVPSRLEELKADWQTAKKDYLEAKAKLEALQESNDFVALEKELDDLSMQGREMNQALAAYEGFSPSAEEVNAWQNEQGKLAVQIPEETREFNQVQGRLKQMRRQSFNFVELESESEYLQSEITKLTERHEASLLAIDVLQEVVDNYRAAYLPQLEKRSSSYWSQITNGRYQDLQLEKSWPEIIVPMQDMQANKTDLSQGALDQLFFALRLAATDLMSSQAQLPLILDDPFVNFDDERYQESLSLLASISQDRQVIYFTSRERIVTDLEAIVPQGRFAIKRLVGQIKN